MLARRTEAHVHLSIRLLATLFRHPAAHNNASAKVMVTLLQGKALEVGPLNYLFMHVNEPGAYCLGVFDNGYQGTLLGGITFRNILVQVGLPRHGWSARLSQAVLSITRHPLG